MWIFESILVYCNHCKVMFSCLWHATFFSFSFYLDLKPRLKGVFAIAIKMNFLLREILDFGY